MTNKDVNKNKLRDKTCGNCEYRLKTFCRHPDKSEEGAVLLPQENTCYKWKQREPGRYRLGATWTTQADLDLAEVMNEDELVDQVSENLRKEFNKDAKWKKEK